MSVLIYEDMYKTTVEDFGCLPHDLHSCMGASPDGINVDLKSERYGRMLEIKNIVNRVINGIPKEEYWVQMQWQMEVCNLDECDFLETRFTEYDGYADYMAKKMTTMTTRDLCCILLTHKNQENPSTNTVLSCPILF